MTNAKLSDIEKHLATLNGEGVLMCPPDWLVSSVESQWSLRERIQTAPTATASIIGRVIAVLRFDSFASSPMAQGVRSGHQSVRQLLFSAWDCDIDIRIAPAKGSTGRLWQVSGQVLGPNSDGVVVLEGQQAKQHVTVDELGEFHFDRINEGDYTMTLDLSSAAIVLPLFRLPP